MTWVKLDDQLHAHPKLQRAWRRDHASLGLHLLALSHSAAYLTDGHVSEEFVEAQLPRPSQRTRACAALVAAGVWEPGESGWMIHDYLDFNESREQVLARRGEQSSQRSAAGRSGARKRWRSGSSPYGELIAPTPTPTPDLFPQLAGS